MGKHIDLDLDGVDPVDDPSYVPPPPVGSEPCRVCGGPIRRIGGQFWHDRADKATYGHRAQPEVQPVAPTDVCDVCGGGVCRVGSLWFHTVWSSDHKAIPKGEQP
jgi:hypothetical protein